MIRALVDFALTNRWLVLGGVIVLTAWGVISFRNLPIEAYPDVANNYVQIITQWPGRSAEEIERQVTVPVEIQMAGIPHLTHLRSTTLAGLSSLMLIFDDDSTSDINREHVLERLNMVSLPANLVPQMGTDWSPVGQIYWYTLESTNPAYDVMEKKSLEDWTLEKSFKSVQGVVDVSSFGGPTKEYQVNLDPEKLVSYGLSIAQVEQQIAANNSNGGGSFIEQGAQQINVQSAGLFTSVLLAIESPDHRTRPGKSLFFLVGIRTIGQLLRIVLDQSIWPGDPHRVRRQPSSQIEEHRHTAINLLLVRRARLHFNFRIVTQLQILNATERNSNPLTGARRNIALDTSIPYWCRRALELTLPIQQRPVRTYNVQPTIIIHVRGVQPLCTRRQLRQRNRFVFSGKFVRIQNSRMIRVTHH